MVVLFDDYAHYGFGVPPLLLSNTFYNCDASSIKM